MIEMMYDRSLNGPPLRTFEELATFIREWAGIPPSVAISPETLFEDDLGITGDDGCELLEATGAHFRVRLRYDEDGYRGTFGLTPDEQLFHDEGFGVSCSLMVGLFSENRTPRVVKAFKVGDLFEAVISAKLADVQPKRRNIVLGLDD